MNTRIYSTPILQSGHCMNMRMEMSLWELTFGRREMASLLPFVALLYLVYEAASTANLVLLTDAAAKEVRGVLAEGFRGVSLFLSPLAACSWCVPVVKRFPCWL